MSNLYKNSNMGGYATRVIDSNSMIARKLQELNSASTDKQFEAWSGEGTETENFQEGLSAPMLEPEPEIDYVAIAKADAEAILEEARERADTLRQEAEINAQSLRQAAQAEGFQKGYEESSARVEQELAIKQAELEEYKQSLQLDYERKLAEMEPQLLDVILQVVEKVFQVQFADKKDIILYLISNTIHHVEGTKRFQIRVSADYYQYVHDHMAEIATSVGSDISLDVIEDITMEEGKCLIDSEVGVFDCSLGVQLENLIKTLRTLCMG